MEIERIAVVGAGQMGTGIAQVAAQAGFTVRLLDVDPKLAQAACQRIDQTTAEAIERFDAGVLTSSHACGSVAMRGLLLAGKRRGMAIERLDLRNSGDTAGPRDRVAGYGSWALFEPAGEQP